MFFLLCLYIIQGFTEFLPVSSSLHLEIFSLFASFPWKDSSQICCMDYLEKFNLTLILHLCTCVCIFIYYRHEILRLLKCFFSFKKAQWRSINVYITASIPSIFVGYFLHKSFFYDSIRSSSFLSSLIFSIFGFILYITYKYIPEPVEPQEQIPSISYKQALWLGLGQILAFMPGVSRLGISLTAGRLIGIHKEKLLPFSFLLSSIFIFGGIFLEGIIFLSNPNDFKKIIDFYTKTPWIHLLGMILLISAGLKTLPFLHKHAASLRFAKYIMLYRITMTFIIYILSATLKTFLFWK